MQCYQPFQSPPPPPNLLHAHTQPQNAPNQVTGIIYSELYYSILLHSTLSYDRCEEHFHSTETFKLRWFHDLAPSCTSHDQSLRTMAWPTDYLQQTWTKMFRSVKLILCAKLDRGWYVEFSDSKSLLSLNSVKHHQQEKANAGSMKSKATLVI